MDEDNGQGEIWLFESDAADIRVNGATLSVNPFYNLLLPVTQSSNWTNYAYHDHPMRSANQKDGAVTWTGATIFNPTDFVNYCIFQPLMAIGGTLAYDVTNQCYWHYVPNPVTTYLAWGNNGAGSYGGALGRIFRGICGVVTP